MGGDGDVGCLVNCDGDGEGGGSMEWTFDGAPLVHHLKLYHFRSRLENVKKNT